MSFPLPQSPWLKERWNDKMHEQETEHSVVQGWSSYTGERQDEEWPRRSSNTAVVVGCGMGIDLKGVGGARLEVAVAALTQTGPIILKSRDSGG